MSDISIPLTAKVRTSILDIVKDWLPVATVIGGAAWALVTFLGHEKELAEQGRLQAVSAQETRNFEARRPFLDQQLKYYIEVAKIAGFLVTHADTDPQWAENNTRFYQLYWSELSMVESKEVENAMAEFKKKLAEYSDPNNKTRYVAHEELNSLSLDLAHAIRADLDSIWKTK